jgi:hypothetical protein
LDLGVAAREGYIDFNHSAFDSLKTFLRGL